MISHIGGLNLSEIIGWRIKRAAQQQVVICNFQYHISKVPKVRTQWCISDMNSKSDADIGASSVKSVGETKMILQIKSL